MLMKAGVNSEEWRKCLIAIDGNVDRTVTFKVLGPLGGTICEVLLNEDEIRQIIKGLHYESNSARVKAGLSPVDIVDRLGFRLGSKE